MRLTDAHANRENRFVTVRVYSGYQTERLKSGHVRELDILRCISEDTTGTHCLHIVEEFIQPGKEGDGEHICVVTDPLGPSLDALYGDGYEFTLPVLKRIFQDVLIGLRHLHGRGIAHTGGIVTCYLLLTDIHPGSTRTSSIQHSLGCNGLHEHFQHRVPVESLPFCEASSRENLWKKTRSGSRFSAVTTASDERSRIILLCLDRF